jgi:hypothetical protein
VPPFFFDLFDKYSIVVKICVHCNRGWSTCLSSTVWTINPRFSNASQRTRSRYSCPRLGVISCEYTMPNNSICSFPDSDITTVSSELKNYASNLSKNYIEIF